MKNNKLTVGKVVKAVWKGYCWASTLYTGYVFLKARGTGKENDLELIGKAIDGLAGYSIDADDIVTIEDVDLHVSYNPYMQLLTNSLGGIACITGTNVYIDNVFRNLSKEAQYAVLCHEIGHRKCNHQPDITYQFDRIKAIKQGTVLPMETEADEYGASVCGYRTMIKGLAEVARYTKGVTKKELILRINHLVEMDPDTIYAIFNP